MAVAAGPVRPLQTQGPGGSVFAEAGELYFALFYLY